MGGLRVQLHASEKVNGQLQAPAGCVGGEKTWTQLESDVHEKLTVAQLIAFHGTRRFITVFHGMWVEVVVAWF